MRQSRQYVGCGCRSGRSRMASVRVGIRSSICLLCPKPLARLRGTKENPCIYLRSDLPSVGIYLQSGSTNLHDIGTPTSDGSYTAQCITAAHHICRRTVGVETSQSLPCQGNVQSYELTVLHAILVCTKSLRYMPVVVSTLLWTSSKS